MRLPLLFLAATCFSLVTYTQQTSFSGKVFLQGAFESNTSLMRTALVQQGGFPLIQPYNLAPWDYDGTEFLLSTQSEMVDWILVDLRTSPDTAIARVAAILYADGTIRDANGDSVLRFDAPPGQYFLAIIHRSHLSAMTATKHAFQNGAILDFIDTTLQVYGTCMIGLGTDKRAMIGGDVNQDRILKYSGAGNDRSPILQRILTEVGGTAINATTTGYFKEDLRMDGTVKYSGSGNDPSLIIQNLISLTGSNAINTTFTGPVPHAIYAPYTCTPQPDQADAGPDSLNIPDTSITLQANQPVNGTGLWSILAGTGGSFADSSVHNTLFTGEYGIVYTLVWTVSNPCGSSSDTVSIGFATSQDYNCGDTLTDTRDGQQYPTVQIGTQCWMAKNLNIGVMANSVSTGSSHSDVSNNGIIEKYCYNNDLANCAIYGGLYDWNEMMGYTTTPGTQGICPTGWHIPTDAEWYTLTDYLGGAGVAGGMMKETGTTHWLSPNTNATNSSGFSALGAGYSGSNGGFTNLSMAAHFWSSSENTSTTGIRRNLNYNNASVTWGNSLKTSGLSVRCLMDSIPPCTPLPDQAFAGPDSLNIPDTSITLQANQPVNGTGVWSIHSGTGGSFADSSLYNTLFTGKVGDTYTLVWIISNPCGSNSDTVVIAFVGTSAYPSGYIHCDPANPTAVVDVTNPTTGKTWMDRNLGASQAATSSTDANAYGDLYQWGRFADGHQCRNSGTTTTLSTTNNPAYGSFIIAPNSPYDWRSPQNTNLWQGINGVNNPCPTGYSLPTEAELNAERLSWSSNNAAGAFGSPLKLPLAGRRDFSDGLLYNIGGAGFYWSSTVSDSLSRNLYFNSATAGMYSNNRAIGGSVRCIKEDTTCTPQPDQAFAGPDSLNIPDISIALQANQPVNGTGVWSIHSGTGGSFADSSVHNTLFTGEYGIVYTLVWTISNQCGSNSDTVNISFICMPLPDQANAGPDSLNISGTSITLQANQPVNGTGLWTILSGTGGSFADSSVHNTLFTGQVGQVYSLIWAISNPCGSTRDTVVISFVGTSTYPTGYVHCNPGNPTAVVDVTNPVTGGTWMDRNLGAPQAATSSTDANAYGDLYQWGRFADGHQCRNSATTTTLSTTNQPGHSSFITAPNSPYDWRSPQNANLWQGVNGVNNPCPAGYRLPTEAELIAERLSWSSNNSAGAYGSPLKLPLAGIRGNSFGSLGDVGSGGYYWSSTVSGTYSSMLYFDSIFAGRGDNRRANGTSVRCTKDY